MQCLVHLREICAVYICRHVKVSSLLESDDVPSANIHRLLE